MTICCILWLLLMICYEPVQVSTAFSNYRRPTTIKVATNLIRSCTLLLERGWRRNARMTTSFGGRRIYSILAGGSPYSTRPAPNKWTFLTPDVLGCYASLAGESKKVEIKYKVFAFFYQFSFYKNPLQIPKQRFWPWNSKRKPPVTLKFLKKEPV